MAGPSDVIWYCTKMFYNRAQSAVGVVAEWGLAYPYSVKYVLAVVTCRDRTLQPFFHM
jgi:hypothetical protein